MTAATTALHPPSAIAALRHTNRWFRVPAVHPTPADGAAHAQYCTFPAKYHLHRAIDIEPYNEELYYYLGECYAREENWDKALRFYTESIDLDDYREEFHVAIAKAYEKLCQFKKAETHYRKAATCGCELSYYWAKYISFLLQNRMVEKAEKVIPRAEKKSFGADILFTKAAYQFIMKDTENAMETLREALEEDHSQFYFLKEILPGILLDKNIAAMVKYYTH